MSIPLNTYEFLNGMKCNRYLFLHINSPELKADSNQTNIGIENSRIVKAFGKELYKSDVEQDLLDSFPSEPGIYYNLDITSADGNHTCHIDILSLSEYINRVILIKSSTYLKMPQHIYEIGWIRKILEGHRLPRNLKYYVAYLNTEYVRTNGIDIEQLFIQEDVTKASKDVQFIVDKHMYEFDVTLENSIPPKGRHEKKCLEPAKCSFYGQCWKNLPETSLKNVSGISRKTLRKLERSDIEDINEISSDIELSDKVRVQIDAIVSKKASVNKKALDTYLQSINDNGNISFLDFETDAFPIPLYPGTRPYMHVPFQYCLVKRVNPGQPYTKHEFIAKPLQDERRNFIESLMDGLLPDGPIIVYSESFEKSRLRELAMTFPEYDDAISNIIYRIRDLCIPFKDKIVYHPGFKGRYSIKTVLSVLHPELNYNNLNIQNGQMAVIAYRRLSDAPESQQQQIIENLREYCLMDVVAMIKLYDDLKSL